MSWTIDLRTRAGVRVNVPADVEIRVRRVRWAAMGGPTVAELDVSGPRDRLMVLFAWLGHRIRIYNQYGTRVWWGTVDAVSVGLGGIEVAADLAQVANRVKAIYSYEAATGTVDAETDWSEDAESVDRFGAIERILSLNDTTTAGAEAAVALELARYARPRVTPSVASGSDGASISCVGIYPALDRRYWQNLAGRELHSEDVGGVQNAVGWKMGPKDGIIFGGKAGDLIGDIDAGFTGLPVDQRIVVEGSDNNNIGYVTTAMAEIAAQVQQTFVNFTFDADDDVYAGDKDDDGAEDWSAFTAGNPVLFEGDTPMDGVLTFFRDKVLPNYMLVHPKLVLNDSNATNITVTQGNAIEVSPQPVLEYDGNTITITADGIKVAQSFTLEHDTAAWPLTEVWVHVAKVGDPSDAVKVEICQNNTSQPGTVIESTTVDAANIATEAGWVLFQFSTANSLAYGTTYWLQVSRTDPSTTGDFYLITLNDASIYARGSLKMTGAAGTYNARLQGDASMNFELWGHLSNVAQLAAILGDQELVEGVDFSQVSASVFSRQYREGDLTVRDTIEGLLQQTSARWLLTVDAAERAVIYPAPDEDEAVGILGLDGRVRRRYGGGWELGTPIVGVWLLMDDLPAYNDDIVGAGALFVEACEFTVEDGTLALEFTDRRGWTIDGIVQG